MCWWVEISALKPVPTPRPTRSRSDRSAGSAHSHSPCRRHKKHVTSSSGWQRRASMPLGVHAGPSTSVVAARVLLRCCSSAPSPSTQHPRHGPWISATTRPANIDLLAANCVTTRVIRRLIDSTQLYGITRLPPVCL